MCLADSAHSSAASSRAIAPPHSGFDVTHAHRCIGSREPDTVGTLQTLKRSGVRVIALSNFSPAMLRANAEYAHLTDLVDALVSTDENRTYKPDPRAYQLGVDRLHLAKSATVFAASAGWDAAAAKSFGCPTFWVNRANQPAEELGVTPDATSPDLTDLLEFVLRQPTGRSAR